MMYAGAVTTFAGSRSGIAGSADSAVSSMTASSQFTATFDSPLFIASDSNSSRLIVTQGGSHPAVRGIDLSDSNRVVTLTSSTPSTSASFWTESCGYARFYAPTGVAVTANGDVIVIDGGAALSVSSANATRSTVLKLSSHVDLLPPALPATPTTYPVCETGVVSGGYGVNGSRVGAGAASYDTLSGILTVDNGNIVIVTDARANAVRMVNTSTSVSSVLAGGQFAGLVDGIGSSAQFQTPTAIAQSLADSDVVYIADSGNNAIRGLRLSTGEYGLQKAMMSDYSVGV